jgi:hypothetical protein
MKARLHSYQPVFSPSSPLVSSEPTTQGSLAIARGPEVGRKHDFAALAQERTRTASAVSVRVTQKTSSDAQAIVSELVSELKSAAALMPLATQLDGIDRYHLGDVQYGMPSETVMKHLERTLGRTASLRKEGKASADDLTRIEERALDLWVDHMLEKIEPELAALEARPYLRPIDREAINWIRIDLRPLDEAVKALGAPASPRIAKAVERFSSAVARLDEAAANDAPNPPPKQVTAGEMKSLLSSLSINWDALEKEKLSIWRSLLPDAIALLDTPADRLSLNQQVGHKLFYSGLKVLRYAHESATNNAAGAGSKSDQVTKRASAVESAEIWLDAVTARADSLLRTQGGGVEAQRLLADALKGTEGAIDAGASVELIEAKEAAARALDAAREAILSDGEDFAFRADKALSGGDKGFALKSEAERIARGIEQIPEALQGRNELFAEMRSIYSRIHQNELEQTLKDLKASLAAHDGSPEKIEEAESNLSAADDYSDPARYPLLDAASAADRARVLDEIHEIASKLREMM